MVKKSRNANKKSFIEVALIVIGLTIILISLVTWVPREQSELMFKINFLSLSIGVLYIVFALTLRKINH